jgi:hypothetical protein
VPSKQGARREAPIGPSPLSPEPSSVLFDLRTASSTSGGAVLYDCTYSARGRTARFQLRLVQKGPWSNEDFPVASARVEFLAVGGSENGALMEDLMKALDAKQVPASSPRVSDLAFGAVLLGVTQSKDPSGGFSDKPKGDWETIKVFLPRGGDDAEFFLNINPVAGKAEFSIKDSDYGDYVVAQLAKVL